MGSPQGYCQTRVTSEASVTSGRETKVQELHFSFDAYFHFSMAKRSMVVKAQKKPKFSTRTVRRCFKCGRPRAFMRDFNLCRICFREEALEGHIPGVKKSSW